MSSGNVITKIYAEMHQVRGKQERQLPDEQVTRRRQVPGEQEWLSDYALADEKPGKEAVDYPIRPTKARRMRQLQNALVSPKPISQTDCYKPFYMQILQFGLNYAYHMQTQPSGDNDHFKYTKTKKPKHIIVVGAGMSGLSAAYELAQVGHKVTIIEKQSRVGGRVKTLSEPHFSKGLWSDSGAMREPGTGLPDWQGPKHFLTDWYTDLFQLKRIPFINYCGKGFYCFYGKPKIRMEDWDREPGKYCTQFWPGWDAKLTPEIKAKFNITDINTYYNATIAPVAAQIRANADSKMAWQLWMFRWSKLSLVGFLRSDLKSILEMVGEEFEEELQPLSDLLPWPEIAITAYSVFNYTRDQEMEACLAHGIREDLGLYWLDPMHTIEGGLSSIPWAFMEKNQNGWNKEVNLSKCVKFGLTVRAIEYRTATDDAEHNYVKVTCYNETSQEMEEHTANSVIITTPLHIIREMTFEPPLPSEIQNALSGVYYGPSTKIFIQSKTRFWETEGIVGGFTKTNMPIGQLHYPSNKEDKDERGILMCYTWGNEALMFGSQSHQNAIAQAIRQVSQIHPKIKDNFEVGAVQAWYSDPSSQGAYAVLKPDQYINICKLMYPHGSIFFAGEAISWTTGWIQGALESGLRAAYQFYIRNEQSK